MNDAWETDNDSDDDSLQDQLDDLTRRFLSPDRGKRPTQPTQTSTQNAPEKQAKRVEGDSILQNIRYLKNTYGPAPTEDARPIPYAEAAKLFERVEIWARQTRVLDACERVEKAVKTIEEAANRLQDKQPASYAQAARTGGTRAAQGVALDAPQKIHLKEEKRVTVKIPDKKEADIIKYQPKEEIVARIQQRAGGKDAIHTVLAVR
jgi:hypothetical protein